MKGENVTSNQCDAPPKFSEYEAEWSKRGYEPHIATLLAKADWSEDMINWQEDEIDRLHNEIEAGGSRERGTSPNRSCGTAGQSGPASSLHDWSLAPADATHYQPHQRTYYKRISATEWFVWSRLEREQHRWMESPGTSDSADWIKRPTHEPPAARYAITLADEIDAADVETIMEGSLLSRTVSFLRTGHHEYCDVNDKNIEGIKKPCNCGAAQPPGESLETDAQALMDEAFNILGVAEGLWPDRTGAKVIGAWRMRAAALLDRPLLRLTEHASTALTKPACDCEGPQKIGPEYHAPYCATMAGTEFAKRYAPTDETGDAP